MPHPSKLRVVNNRSFLHQVYTELAKVDNAPFGVLPYYGRLQRMTLMFFDTKTRSTHTSHNQKIQNFDQGEGLDSPSGARAPPPGLVGQRVRIPPWRFGFDSQAVGPSPPWVGARSPDGLDETLSHGLVGQRVRIPPVLGSIPKRWAPGHNAPGC